MAQIEGLDDIADPNAHAEWPVCVLWCWSRSPKLGLLSEARFLPGRRLPLPAALVSNAVGGPGGQPRVPGACAGARRLCAACTSGTLTLSLFLAVFGAVLLAVLLGNQLARPLLVLAEGVREVAAGDLSPKAALQGKR